MVCSCSEERIVCHIYISNSKHGRARRDYLSWILSCVQCVCVCMLAWLPVSICMSSLSVCDVCVLTSVNDEPYRIWAQCVIKGNHHHGIGVASQLWDDPLKSHRSQVSKVRGWSSFIHETSYTHFYSTANTFLFFLHVSRQKMFICKNKKKCVQLLSVCVFLFTSVVCMNETICKMVYIHLVQAKRNEGERLWESRSWRDRARETETDKTKGESHLWPVLSEHSYELVGVGLAALVQKAWTQMLSPGRHLWSGEDGTVADWNQTNAELVLQEQRLLPVILQTKWTVHICSLASPFQFLGKQL